MKVKGFTIGDFVSMAIDDLANTIDGLAFAVGGAHCTPGAHRDEKRLHFLTDVGVDTFPHPAGRYVSGGESQEWLATQISRSSASSLRADEPTVASIRRTRRTGENPGSSGISAIRSSLWSTTGETMLAADAIVELGPGAGENGGEVLFAAIGDAFKTHYNPGPFLRGERNGIVRAPSQRKPGGFLTVKGARHNNLRGINVKFPTGLFIAVTGVSGSGKSSLIHDVLYKGLRRHLDRDFRERAGKHSSIEGWEQFRNVILVDQSPIGRTPRSNPATYTGLFTLIRELFAGRSRQSSEGICPGIPST